MFQKWTQEGIYNLHITPTFLKKDDNTKSNCKMDSSKFDKQQKH
jgi:hypothetical protein